MDETSFQGILSKSWLTSTPNLYILILDEDSDKVWKIPEWVRPADKVRQRLNLIFVLPYVLPHVYSCFTHRTQVQWSWRRKLRNAQYEYRLMGHWRLGFTFPFARALGYKYLLQVGPRSLISSALRFLIPPDASDPPPPHIALGSTAAPRYLCH